MGLMPDAQIAHTGEVQPDAPAALSGGEGDGAGGVLQDHRVVIKEVVAQGQRPVLLQGEEGLLAADHIGGGQLHPVGPAGLSEGKAVVGKRLSRLQRYVEARVGPQAEAHDPSVPVLHPVGDGQGGPRQGEGHREGEGVGPHGPGLLRVGHGQGDGV